jgi:hypothetical protein
MIVSVSSSDGEVTSEMNEKLLQDWYDEVFSAGLGMPSAEKAHVAAIRALGDLESYYRQDWDPAWSPVTSRGSSKSFRSRISALKGWRTATAATEGEERSTKTSGSIQSNRGSDFATDAFSALSQAGTRAGDSLTTGFKHSLLAVPSLPSLRRMRSRDDETGSVSVVRRAVRKTKSFYTASNGNSLEN